MLSLRSSFTEITASLSFRQMDRSRPTYVFFTYCWVMVEPPCTALRLRMSAHVARASPMGSTPEWRKKLRSSVSTTARRTTGGTSSRRTRVRLPVP